MDSVENFLDWFFYLKIDSQKKFMKWLFNNKVLTFDICRIDDRMYIRYYDGDMYYQFCFLFCFNDDILNIKLRKKVIIYNIFVKNYDSFIFIGDNLDKFIKMLNGNEFIDFDYFLGEEI